MNEFAIEFKIAWIKADYFLRFPDVDLGAPSQIVRAPIRIASPDRA